jgi:pyruvate dehydrogenase E2 component (dihydrolipoamide acetyltransferase)
LPKSLPRDGRRRVLLAVKRPSQALFALKEIKMAVNVIMPKLGLTMESGTIAKWNFKDGAAVKAGDVLYQVETDKLTNDVEAEIDGILHIKRPQGAVVPATQVVGVIAAPGEAVSFGGAASLPAGKPESASLPDGKPEAASCAPVAGQVSGQGQVSGSGQGQETRARATPKARKLAAEMGLDLALIAGTGPDGMIAVKDLENLPPNKLLQVKTTPLAAKVAADLNVNLASITTTGSTGPTGQTGRIFKDDVLAALPAAQAQLAAVAPVASVVPGAPVRRVPMSAMRRAIARNMSASWALAPMVHYDLRADVTALGELKKNLCLGGKKISYTDILVKVVATALKAHPLVNASLEGDEIILHDYVNMGVAVALPNGLIVPVIKGVEGKSIGEISDELKALAEKALQGKLVTEEFSGGTFTISNLGMYGVESFTPIVNQPESAILGVNAIVKTATEVEGQIVMRPLINLSLSADHRVVDGAEAARFIARIREIVESPWQMLL